MAPHAAHALRELLALIEAGEPTVREWWDSPLELDEDAWAGIEKQAREVRVLLEAGKFNGPGV